MGYVWCFLWGTTELLNIIWLSIGFKGLKVNDGKSLNFYTTNYVKQRRFWEADSYPQLL
jgi:hypothetical protein